MKVVIMAGGLGKRIAEIDSTIPKPLIKIANKPILQWEIECLARQGFNDLILTVSHMAEKIQDYFGDGSAFGCKIEYFVEQERLGNAGALFKLWEEEKLDGNFLLLNADSMFDVDFNRFISFHEEKHNALATLFTHPNNHPYDSTIIVANNETGVIKQWLTKEDERPEFYRNCVNAGLHIINTDILSLSGIKPEIIDADHKVDLDRDVLKPLIKTGRIYSYSSPEYVKDMGTPERFEQVTNDILSGKVQARNLSKPQKAIFLDRDGTINKSVGFLKNIDDFELLPDVVKAVKKINASSYLCIVVTNQPVIARGEATVEELEVIHNKMETLLGNEGAYLDAIYYCPHHPDKGFEGEVPELKIDCDCRKPKPGMLLEATRDFNIDLKASWMIGDSDKDIEAGKSAGCSTILLTEENPSRNLDHNDEEHNDGNLTKEIEPDFYVSNNLLFAVNLISVLDRTDLSSVDNTKKYLLYNKRIGLPFSFFSNDYRKSRVIETDFSTALAILVEQDNSEDFDLITSEEFLQKSVQNPIPPAKCTNTDKENKISHHYFMILDEKDTEHCSPLAVTFDEYFQYLLNGGLAEIENDLLQKLDLQQWEAYNDENMISSMLFKSEVDYQKKIRTHNYYKAHGKCAIESLKELFSQERYNLIKKSPQVVQNTYCEILKHILIDIEQLINLYQVSMKNNTQYSATVRIPIHTMSLHNLLRQSIYGYYSFDSFSDYEPADAIAVIRQMIELRIRRAIGILGFVKSDGNPENLNLSDVFAKLKQYPEIEYPAKVENLERIYKWANYYIHSGRGDWSWIPIFVEKYLRDLSFGIWRGKSWSYNNAFRIPRITLSKIEHDIQNMKPSLKLFRCELECEIINIKKLLSICTAAYNAENFISKMIDSILASKHSDEIELIIIDDGSEDDTQSIVQKYVIAHPRIVNLVTKKNGGSGSARNVAFKMATGKYIKLIDADDYVDTKRFDIFIDTLKKIDADLIINPHYNKKVDDENLLEINPYKEKFQEGQFQIDNIPQAEYFSMHDVTYRTSIIRDNHIQLSEGKSYVDMEYLTLPIQYVHSYAYIPEPFYVYQIGIPGQSIDAKVQLKKQGQKRDIISRIKGFIESTELSAGQRLVVNNSFERILKSLVNDYRGVCSLKYRKAMKENDQYVKSLSENAYKDLGKDRVIRAFRATNYFAYYPYMMIKYLYRMVKRACTAKKVAGCR